jgi:hypothetical protein
MKRVGYGIVGLAMVLLGILIIVPFLKSVFPQLDGYVDYPADVIAAAQANTALLNDVMANSDRTINVWIDNINKEIANLQPTDPKIAYIKIYKMALNAINGDQASVDTVNKILVGAKLPPWQPPPSPVVPATTPSDVITYIQGNISPLIDAMNSSIYSIKHWIAAVSKKPTSTTNTTLIGVYTLAYAAKTGDPNALTIVNKLLTGAGKPAWQPDPAPAPAAPPTTTGPVPSLSVNTARPSSTIDLLKSACQSLLADVSAPIK